MASETDWLGKKVVFTTDADGNQTSQDNNVSTSSPTGSSGTTFGYDAADENTAATSTLSQACSSSAETLTQSFGGSGGSRNADGQVTQNTVGYSGSCSGQTNTERNYSYDPGGRVVYEGSTAQGPSPNNISYDASGDPTTISEHSSTGTFGTFSQTFDASGAVTGQSPSSGSSGSSSTYSYDSIGAQTTDISGSGSETTSVNAAGKMTNVSAPGGTSSYLYNGDGLEAAAQVAATTVGPPTAVDTSNVLESVSCASTTFCQAVDNNGSALSFNGTSWTSATRIDGTSTLDSVSCPSAALCIAVDNDGHALRYNGTSWSPVTSIDGTNVLNSVSCASATFCAVVDSKGNVLTYNGTTWSAAKSIDGTKKLVSISCPSTTFCLAIDTSDNWVSYNGTTWTAAKSVEATDTVEAVSCSNSSSCVAVDNAGDALTFNGSSWSNPDSIDGNSTLDSISCPSVTSCVAVDNDGNSLTFNGTSWSGASSIDGTRKVDAISCSEAAFCVAVDSNGDSVTYGATPWSQPSSVDGTGTLESVSCPSAAFCAAIDSSGHALTYNGTSWSQALSIDGSNVLESVSCASTTLCVAVDSKGNELTFNGGSWTSAKSIDGTKKLVGLSCPSTTFCLAVDSSDNALTYNGTAWSTAKSVEAVDTLVSVSCSSATFCVAVDNAGHAISYNGNAWASAETIDGNNTVDSVSCTSATFCTAVDNNGFGFVYNGTNWSSGTAIDGGNALESVSCASSSYCVATDAKGNAITYNGTTWLDPASIDSTHKVDSISCPAVNQCMAVDSVGNGTVYGSVQQSSTSQLTWDTNGSLATVLSDGTNDFVYGPTSEPVEQINVTSTPPASNPQFMTYTSSDSSWLITSASGQELNFYDYDAFGTLSQGTPGSPFGYAGQYTDVTTGLSNMRARWYTPQTGEFNSVDPDLAQTDTAFTYAGNDPVNQTDPSGQDAKGCTTNGFSPFGNTTCIQITGQSDIIWSIHIWGEATYNGCSVAQLTVNGQVKFEAPERCVENQTNLSATWGCLFASTCPQNGVAQGAPWAFSITAPDGTNPLRNGDQVCGQFVGTDYSSSGVNGTSGRPCETIEGNANSNPYKSLPTLPRLANPLPSTAPYAGYPDPPIAGDESRGGSGTGPSIEDPNATDSAFHFPEGPCPVAGIPV